LLIVDFDIKSVRAIPPTVACRGKGTIASWCAVKELGDIVLWNRSVSRAKGTAFDLMESAPLVGFDVFIKGTANLKDTKNSDVVVFTAGLPRKPGMTREELVGTNAKIIVPLIKKLAKLSPKAIFVMVTNPLDAMTYAVLKNTKLHKKQVIGMAGILDSSRFCSFIAKELKVSTRDVSALVMGSHGEAMVPLPRHATVGGIALTDLMSKSTINKLVKHTQQAGAEIVKLLKANASFKSLRVLLIYLESMVFVIFALVFPV